MVDRLNKKEVSMEMVLFIGIQAVGKSEFFKQRFYKTHIRLNMDMLKTRHREGLLFDACIAAKQPFVVDNTNPTAEERQKYIIKAKNARFGVSGFYFQSSINDAINCNKQREDAVPDVAIFATHKKLELPRLDEGFDSLSYVRKNGAGGFIVEGFI